MSQRRWGAWLLAAALLLGGCSFEDDPSWREVGTLDGQLVAIDAGLGKGNIVPGRFHLVSDDDGRTWAPAPPAIVDRIDEVELAESSELCLTSDPSVCIRTDATTVWESSDGGATYERVWELDLSGRWLTRQLANTFEAEIAIGAPLETADGSAVVPVGAIHPIHRAPDGTWSPTEADLRRFPVATAVFIALALVALSVGVAARPTAWTVIVSGVYLITLPASFVYAARFGALLVAFATTAFAVVVIVLFTGDGARSVRLWRVPSPMIWAPPIAVFGAATLAWSEAVIGWRLLEMAVVIAVAWILVAGPRLASGKEEARTQQLPPPAVPPPPMPTT